jgi:dipeptidyl aminopeptidase/acylaminoacyl peptidase
MKRSYLFNYALLVIFFFYSHLLIHAQQTKIPLDHSVYESWKNLENARISNNGKWVTYEINPQQGDGYLYLVNIKENRIDSVPRGYNPVFSNQSEFLVFRIKPQYAVVRQAKKDKIKIKKDKIPKDSMGIWLMDESKPVKFPEVKSFKVPQDGTGWFVFQHHEAKDTTKFDTTLTDTTIVDQSKEKARGSKLVIIHPLSNKTYSCDHVVSYEVSRQGKAFGFVQESSDTIPVSTVSFFDTDEEKLLSVFNAQGKIPRLALDEPGKQMAFLYHQDTSKIVGYDMYKWNASEEKTNKIIDTLSAGMTAEWGISKHGNLDEEKFHVDIWNWKDTLLQPMQKKRLDNEKKRTYLAVYHIKEGSMVQLADELVEETRTLHKGNGDVLLGFARKPYEKLMSWEASWYRDVYLINVLTGEKTLVLGRKSSVVDLSPHGKYILWYETGDSSWYAHNIAEDRLISLTPELPVHFYEETFDEPGDPYPYGFAGWSGDDQYVFIYDRYDIWKIELTGKYKPLNLTNGYGRKTQTQFRYRKIDREEYYISLKEPLFLSSYNENTKETGFCSSSPLLQGDPVDLISGPYSYSSPVKSRYEDVLIWSRGNFREYPDIYTSALSFSGYQKISNTNPQSSNYLWGDARLVHWISYDNEPLDGILYIPEQIEKDKKYPMLVYFYEKMSQALYSHYIPSPSRSTINFPYCVSNGYIVFIPDIHYKNGYPGQSAYNCVVSGTMAMADRFDFIDRDHMAIQGQSWGGYQVAYLVTRINPYAAAMAGAPVSNMTSAYGGIRWGSGMSRMWQYEEAQSRIGGTLWEKTGLYMENSPLFHVPEIETPLLMMHNDNDGAVPWYQGIELFVALRRLNKPAWMLVYNNEEHNLTKWPNRVDLSIRMMQFFDHYLKGAPAPEWMYQGIPAIEKGINDGYQLVEE